MKIFNRDGILQHTSETTSGLEKMIAWKPSGTLIASSQFMANNTREIVFFEKNGLKHGQFKLPYKVDEFRIDKIIWSYDSSILLVCGFRTIKSADNDHQIQEILFFTQNNYHWYLKQKIQFKENHEFIRKILWDGIEYLKIHMISVDYHYHCYQYELIRQTTENGNVLLIDGNQLNVSDMNSTVIPPPLYTYSIKFTDAKVINQLCYHNHFLAVFFNDNDVVIILKLTEATIENIDHVVGDYPITYQFENISTDFRMIYLPIFCDKIMDIGQFLLPLIDDDVRIFGCIDRRKICCFDYSSDHKEIHIDHQLEFDCNHMLLMPDKKSLLLINSMNQFFQFDYDTGIVSPLVQNATMNSYDGQISKILLFTDDGLQHSFILTKNYSLYHNGMLVMKSNVNSILIHNNGYLLFTTIDHQFYCWPIKNFDLQRLQRDFPGRNLERESKLLTISEANSRVIVELPRGNLEAFYPRCLLLDLVDKHLDSKRFVEAFEILRKNRINLNYLCDYNFEMFMKNCGEFVEQLGDDDHIDWLCLLMFDLSPANHYHLLTNHKPEIRIENKMNRICNEFMAIFTQMDEIRFLKPILLCHVKKDSTEIDQALTRIYRLNDGNLQSMALKFLLSIVDSTRLIEEALGTYDFNILLMVVSKSNKDPKEFQMLIDDFRSIDDDNYRKYRIDLYLHRYRKCLQHLQKCPDKLQEALQLIEDKHLYNDAIEIYGLNQIQQQNIVANGFEQIWNLYGDYLFKKCYYEESGIAYDRASNHLQAYKMYVQSGNWHQACVCARKAYPPSSSTIDDDDDNDSNYQQLLHSLQQNLIMNGNHNAAAYIVDNYLNNHEEAFIILIKGHLWYDAIRLHHKYRLNDCLLQKEFLDEMIDAYDHLMDNLTSKIEIIQEHLLRLKELKENSIKLNKITFENQRFIGSEHDIDQYSDTSSIHSDTSSLQSYQSGMTNQTLKTNVSLARKAKRMEQKRYLLKKGSINEDIQIIYTIKELIIQNSPPLFQQGHDLIRILYDRFRVDQSKKLQQSLQSFEDCMNHAIEFIWKSTDYNERLQDGKYFHFFFVCF